MRTPIYIKGGMRCLFAFLLAATTTGMSLTSCVSDNDANEKSIFDYSDTDVKSYGDLFQVFWSVMNQRYCTLNEQSAVSSQTWDQVYKEYKPKFDALKTFQHTSAFTQQEIQEDNAKAKLYFQEIIDKIIDQHFYVKITLPVSHSSTETVRFNSTLRNKTEYFPLNAHWNHTCDQLNLDGTAFGEITSDGFCIMGGYLKEQPGTYYLGFNKFALYENCFHEYQKSYLPVNAASTYHLDASTISAKAKALIADAGKREKAEQQAAQLLADMDSYLASDDAAKACEKMVAYSNQGDYSGLYALASEAYEKSPNLLKLLPITSDASGMGEQIRQKLQGDAHYQQMLSASGFAYWYCQALADYLWHERELYAYWSDLKFTYNHLCVEGYRRLFLEPLAKGEIQKLILDFRGNGGGSVIDTRLLTDYLITQTAVYAYVRKKEDNNPYSYTPWIPQKITVTSKSLGRNIPTAILLDNYSASMSEVTTLILKSQGDHVKTIGRNSYGAQAMLTSDNEASNGGWIGNVTSYLYFYMPFSLTKDAQGNLLESVGITPDYLTDEMTQEEKEKLYQNDPSAVDRGLKKAMEVLK